MGEKNGENGQESVVALCRTGRDKFFNDKISVGYFFMRAHINRAQFPPLGVSRVIYAILDISTSTDSLALCMCLLFVLFALLARHENYHRRIYGSKCSWHNAYFWCCQQFHGLWNEASTNLFLASPNRNFVFAWPGTHESVQLAEVLRIGNPSVSINFTSPPCAFRAALDERIWRNPSRTNISSTAKNAKSPSIYGINTNSA